MDAGNSGTVITTELCTECETIIIPCPFGTRCYRPPGSQWIHKRTERHECPAGPGNGMIITVAYARPAA